MSRFALLFPAVIAAASLAMFAGCDEEPAGAAGSHQSAAHPEVFFQGTLDEARLQAQQTGKLLLVDATAVWCLPCKEMDKSTWIDPTLASWMAEHVVAVQIDIDRERDVADALKLAPPIPIVAVFKDGVETNRSIGFKSAQDMLAWLEGALKSLEQTS